MLTGCDISAYQNAIPDGRDFVILKATEGLTYDDAPFASRWAALAKSGTLRGAYHFAHPTNSARAEADHFVGKVRAAGLRPGDVLVLDHETRGDSPAKDAAFAQEWCARVLAETGIRPVVYTYLSFAEEGRCAGLGQYPLWIADPSRPAGRPRVPAPWTRWVLHQYSEAGGLDHDVFNGSPADWLALGGAKPQPTPQEDDMPYGQVPPGKGQQVNHSCPRGSLKAIGLVVDNSLAITGTIEAEPQAQVRYAVHQSDGVWQTGIVKVGSADGGKDHSPKVVVHFDKPDLVDWFSLTRLDAGSRSVGWDAS